MGFNNAPLIKALEGSPEPLTYSLTVPLARRRVVSEPCLPAQLPKSSFLCREAESLAPKELERQLSSSLAHETDSVNEDEAEDAASNVGNPEEVQQEVPSSPRSPSIFKSFVKSLMAVKPKTPTSWNDVQPYEIMRAVEERDFTFLMEVRDRAFPLLLRTSGGETPLVHAIRIGNKDVAIVLLGAFSRYINHLEDSDITKPETQSQLKALRVGLKLAINEGLANSQRDLIASFMQALIMSEGDKWIRAQASMVSLALNAGPEGTPVQLAGAAVRKFTTRELGKTVPIASVEDYIANATADLLVMAAWSIVLQFISGDNIPCYYFARDNRVYKAFVARLYQNKAAIDRFCPRHLRTQLQVLRHGLEGRNDTFRKKVELLAIQLDNKKN